MIKVLMKHLFEIDGGAPSEKFGFIGERQVEQSHLFSLT
jgi:hypothetical protein